MALDIMDPATGIMHNAALKPAKSVTIPAKEEETYKQLRERFLLRWCREKNSQGWCGTFDNIMVHDLGYTAKEVLEARARFDYQHSAEVTFTASKEINKTNTKALTDGVRRYLRDYFAIQNTAAATATLEMVSPPEPGPTDLSELQQEKNRVLNTILSNRFLSPGAELDVLHTLGYTDAEINTARLAGRWTYKLSLNWHCAHRINYPTDTRRHIEEHVTRADRDFLVTEVQITPGTTIELN